MDNLLNLFVFPKNDAARYADSPFDVTFASLHPAIPAGDSGLEVWFRAVRDTPISALSDQDLARAIRQQVHLPLTLREGLGRLSRDPLRGALYPGELLLALQRAPDDLFSTWPQLRAAALRACDAFADRHPLSDDPPGADLIAQVDELTRRISRTPEAPGPAWWALWGTAAQPQGLHITQTVTLGRRPDATFQHPDLARLHAELTLRGDALWLIAHKQTLRNGAPLDLHAAAPLAEGDVLEVGPLRLLIARRQAPLAFFSIWPLPRHQAPGPARQPAPPRDRLGDFELTRPIHSGRFNEVFEGRAPDGARVALKLARTSQELADGGYTMIGRCAQGFAAHTGSTAPQDPDPRDLLRLEYDQLCALDAGPFVRPLALQEVRWRGAQRALLVTAWVEGASLSAQPRRAWPAHLLVLADALASLEAQGRAWGDVKPDNLIITPQGAVTLLDPSSGLWERTHGRAILTTPEYNPFLSPSDAPSLGLLCVEAALEAPPFGELGLSLAAQRSPRWGLSPALAHLRQDALQGLRRVPAPPPERARLFALGLEALGLRLDGDQLCPTPPLTVHELRWRLAPGRGAPDRSSISAASDFLVERATPDDVLTRQRPAIELERWYRLNELTDAGARGLTTAQRWELASLLRQLPDRPSHTWAGALRRLAGLTLAWFPEGP